MNNKIALFGAFSLGALAGGASVFAFIKKNYIKKDIYEKEISTARKEYAEMQEELLEEKNLLEEEKRSLAERNTLEKARIMDDYKKGISSFGYVDEVLGRANNSLERLEQKPKQNPIFGKDPWGKTEEKEKDIPEQVEDDDEDKIYLIGEEDFGQIGYDIRDVTFYDNGYVTDEVGQPITNIEEAFGDSIMDILSSYSQGGFKEAYVRNDVLKVDFDIELAGTDFFVG